MSSQKDAADAGEPVPLLVFVACRGLFAVAHQQAVSSPATCARRARSRKSKGRFWAELSHLPGPGTRRGQAGGQLGRVAALRCPELEPRVVDRVMDEVDPLGSIPIRSRNAA
jgi:hypothetical protein